MILRDLKEVISSRAIFTILLVSSIIKLLLVLFILPGTPSSLGPDEGTYAAAIKHLSQGNSAENFPIYGARLIDSSMSILAPGILLFYLGLDELSAIRIVSCAYGIVSSIFFALSYRAYQRLKILESKRTTLPIFDTKFLVFFILFSFFPSNFLWSTIGLRESGSQCLILATFYFLLTLYSASAKGVGNSWKEWLLVIISLTLSYGARSQTSLVFGLTLVSSLILLIPKFRKKFIFLALSAAMIGMILGHSYTSSGASSGASSASNYLNQSLQGLIMKRNSNAASAQSALPISGCLDAKYETFSLLICNLSELPYRLFSFLLRPLLFFDQGSTSLTLAAIENVIWAILILLFLSSLLVRKQALLDKYLHLNLVTYIIFFASASSLYEGNLGTAFRHKSTILWPLLFILMITPNFFTRTRSEV